ncbi:MAG TPA: PilN domain-containing protein [Candidatus Saccharimonadia bacterium]
MINLMPPALKEQIRYAKLNRLVLRYVKVTVLVVVVLGGIFGWALWQVGINESNADKDLADKQAQISKLTASFVPQAKQASDRLAAIRYVQDTQTHFSKLIDDIAKVVPQGVSIDSMTLNGDDKTPLRINITAQKYADALNFRNAMTTSPRVAAADLESITGNAAGGFQAVVVVGFKAGQAK